MPELPEVRAHAERLTTGFAGKKLERFEPLAFTVLKTFAPPADAAHGATLDAVGQRGKYLLLDFGPTTHVVHLMQGGRLKPDPKQSKKPRNGQGRWKFADGDALLLTEAGSERKAGVWVVEDPALAPEPLDRLGPDADTLDRSLLDERIGDATGRLHGWLRDQGNVAGLGRRLANEICHRARLSPFAGIGKLDDDERDRLVAAVQEAINESLDFERGCDEMSSSAERPSGVHHREGEACPACGDEVRAVEYVRYTVNYCATCQTGGKVLADNTTSKFLK